MPHKKRRVMQNIMEEKSVSIVRNKLPEEWVMHQYAPDYGIDFVIETFEYVDEKKKVAETLGEFFFVQLKSVENIEKKKITVQCRYNIEKSLELRGESTIDIEVIKFPLEIDEILTVQSMGYSVPTVLLLVDLSTENVYFVCLNDYIEKILLPENKLMNNASVTLYIPLDNNIELKKCLCHLSFLARRSKLIGAFNKFHYQRHELYYNNSKDVIIRFISIIKSYDFWETKVKWPALEGMGAELSKIEEFLSCKDIVTKKECLQRMGCLEDLVDYGSVESMDEFYINMYALPFWDKLCNLGGIYEEICKEWFLPTYFWHELY